jgi:hypothetical protein
MEFFRINGDVDKLEKFYLANEDVLKELRDHYPGWENHVNKHVAPEVRAGLRNRGIPI